MKIRCLAFFAMGIWGCSSPPDLGEDRDLLTGVNDASSSGDGGNNGSSGSSDGGCGGPVDPDAGGPHGTPGPPNAKRMFVTSASYTGNLASQGNGTGRDPGADGADKLCAAAAVSANLGGSWKAWISSYIETTNPAANARHAIDRIADVPGGWYNVDRTAWLFRNKANLATVPSASEWWSSSFGVSLLEDENGRHVGMGTSVWTGTDTGGRLSGSSTSPRICSSWTSAVDMAGMGGVPAPNPSYWTGEGTQHCSTKGHLYCFEQ